MAAVSVIMSRVKRHHSLLSRNQTERMLLQQHSDQQHSCVNLNTLLDLAVFSCKLFLQIHEETCRHKLCNNHCWSLSFPRMQVLQNPALLINLLFSHNLTYLSIDCSSSRTQLKSSSDSDHLTLLLLLVTHLLYLHPTPLLDQSPL